MNSGKRMWIRGVAGVCALILMGGLTLTGCNMPGSDDNDNESSEQQNRDGDSDSRDQGDRDDDSEDEGDKDTRDENRDSDDD